MSEKRKPKTKIIPTARISQRPVNQQPDFNLDDEIQQEEGTGARDRLMTIGHHLEELRRRILWSIGILVFTASIIGFFINDVHAFLTLPYHQLTGLKLYLGSVYASAEILFSLSILLAIVITLPIILFILWGFFTPAVSPRTARMGNVAMGASTLLFWAGVVMCWLYLMPISLSFLFVDLLPPGTAPQVTLEKYYDFLFMMHVGCGVTFQMPLVVVVLGSLGIVTLNWHKRAWRFVIVFILLFAAIIAPPDPMSLMLLATPMTVLYAISVVIVWFIERRRDSQSEESPETD